MSCSPKYGFLSISPLQQFISMITDIHGRIDGNFIVFLQGKGLLQNMQSNLNVELKEAN